MRVHSRVAMLLMAVLFALLVVSPQRRANATPDKCSRIRVVPLGFNPDSYFYLRVVDYNHGSYYRFTQSLTLFRCDLDTLKVKDRITLRETVHTDTTTENNWTSVEGRTTSFNLIAYLREHKVQMVFPGAAPENWKIVDGEFVNVDDKGGRYKLLERVEDIPTLVIEEQTDFAEIPDEIRRGLDSDFPPTIGDAYWVSIRNGKDITTGYLVVLEINVDSSVELHQSLVFVRN